MTSSEPLIRHPDALFIDGDWGAPSSDAKIDVINSGTEELFLRVAEAQHADVDRAVVAARRAFDTGPWPRMSHKDRAVYLKRIADWLAARTDDLATIWTVETGVVNAFARGGMANIPNIYRHYAGLADSYPFEERRQPAPGGGDYGLIVREPVGVVAAIIPWNGPAALIAHKCGPALIAGCTLVLKASPEAPGAAYLFAEACEASGLPAGVVNLVTADREVSEGLVRHPGVDKVTFTGSTAAGRRIASLCGDRIARCTLELGGKSPALILDDYDVGKAAETIAAKAPFMTGQVCSSLTRIIIGRNRHDDFVEALGAAFDRVKVGDPFDPATTMGPLAMARQLSRVQSYVEKGKADGATLVTGGGRPADLNRGYFIEPTVFGNVDNGMSIARDEIFGPVLSVIPVDSEAEGIAVANDTIYGLNASVFTEDTDRAYMVARQLQSGTVGHNSFRTDFSIGFGGFKQSGIGREGGTEGIGAYLESKTIILDALPSHIAA
jgi:acyl-CoA reductase-like NAD-dependent aldehyde dehydrogenase